MNDRKALVHLEESDDIYLWIVDNCPYCGGKHTHGGGPVNGDPRKLLTHRTTHCGLKKLKKAGFDNISSVGYTLKEIT